MLKSWRYAKKTLSVRQLVEQVSGEEKLAVLQVFNLLRITPWSWEVHTFMQ